MRRRHSSLATAAVTRATPGPAAIGAVVLDPSTDPPTRLATVSECIGVTTSNVAEYKALIAGLEAAQEFPARSGACAADSMLVIRQVEGAWKVKQAHLRAAGCASPRAARTYDQVDLGHVPREQNVDADLLVNAALDASERGRPMLLWYVGMSVLLVANVFRSVGVDYRLVALGALLPLVVDLPVGHRAFGHTLCSRSCYSSS